MSSIVRIQENGADFDVIPVNNPELSPNSQVMLNIRTWTPKNILIGGNPLDIEVLHGFGYLSMLPLETGELLEAPIERGSEVTIPSNNVIYWYENIGTDSLLLLDTCPDFDQANEPTLEAVAYAASHIPIR